MRIDIFSDVVCPWCYLGARRFSAALDQVGRDEIEVHWRAFQLDPTAPPEPGDLRRSIEAKYGPGSFESMTERLTTLGRAEGIEYRFDRALRVNTASAHELVAWAGTQGREDEVVQRLFSAYFTEGLDVADPTTLRRLAAEAGLDEVVAAEVLAAGTYREQVLADRAEAHERGISGVPAFVVAEQWVIPGAQDTDRMVQLLTTAKDRVG